MADKKKPARPEAKKPQKKPAAKPEKPAVSLSRLAASRGRRGSR